MFNMDVNQMQLLDMGLNALGFIAGGGVLVVLASIFRRKERQKVPAEVAPGPQTTKEQPDRVPAASSGPGFEFIDLSAGIESKASPKRQSSELTHSRRNRAEVYELAQRMLQSRKPTREISDELGMSQAEVSLLKARSEQPKGEQHV